MDELLTFFKSSTYQKENTISATGVEMQRVYGERLPYTRVDSITGECYIWNEEFIDLCRYAMSTDSFSVMSELEKKSWYDLVAFEDRETIDNEIAISILDKIFVSLVNCEDYKTCGINETTLVDVSPCAI